MNLLTRLCSSVIIFALLPSAAMAGDAKPSTAACNGAPAAVLEQPTPQRIATLRSCIGTAQTDRFLAALLRAARADTQKTDVRAQQPVQLSNNSQQSGAPEDPVAVLQGYRYGPITAQVPHGTVTTFRPAGAPTVNSPGNDQPATITRAQAPVILQQQLDQIHDLNAANTLSKTQNVALQSQLVDAVQPVPRCTYRAAWQAAANGGIGLAASSPIWTRTQVGIFSLLLPIFFAPCDKGAPPQNIPLAVLTPSTIQVKGTATLSVTERNYTGPFIVSTQDPYVSLSPTGSSTGPWTITGQAAGTATLVVTDENGRTTTVVIPVTAGP